MAKFVFDVPMQGSIVLLLLLCLPFIAANLAVALTLCIRDNGNIIGVICFHLFKRETNSAGIGYWIDKEAQGKGIITKACCYLMQYGFNHLHLLNITISCNINNQKSAAVAERLGFLRKTLLPKKEWLYDHYADHICFDMSVDEWKDLRQEEPEITQDRGNIG